MSVEARAVAMYGIYLDSKEELSKFLSHYGVEDFDNLTTAAELVCLNLFTGDPFLIGYHLDLVSGIEKYQALWNSEFKNSPKKPGVCLEVQWY